MGDTILALYRIITYVFLIIGNK